eukprot:11165255-Lingulodinium_polyedra.AAC.1
MTRVALTGSAGPPLPPCLTKCCLAATAAAADILDCARAKHTRRPKTHKHQPRSPWPWANRPNNALSLCITTAGNACLSLANQRRRARLDADARNYQW